MKNYLNEQFGGEKSACSVLRKWRDMCALVNNPKRRFRLANEAAATPLTNQKLRVAVLVSKVAFHLLNGAEASIHAVPKEFKASGFGISADDAGSIGEGHNHERLKLHGGVEGIAGKLKTCLTNGLTMDDKDLTSRKQLFGTNEFTEREQQSFWVFVYEALQDMTLMVLALCAFVLLLVGIANKGWPTGSRNGLGILASILLVLFVTATSDYRRSIQKKKITIQVTRNGYRQKLSIYELLPGDIVHLDIGDQVPADGIFLSGFAVSIDKSSLTGESEPVKVNPENPYLLCGTKVQDGSCKMLVVSVGVRTQWGKLVETRNEGGNVGTPLQVK